MKAATAKQIKDELKMKTQAELLEYCLRLARFKKENKELLTYLLFEADDELSYVQNVKETVNDMFSEINTRTYYFIKKGLRKILTHIRKYSRYSARKETEIELHIYFCHKMKDFRPSIKGDPRLESIYLKQIMAIKKKLEPLHEDLQYDYGEELEELRRYLK